MIRNDVFFFRNRRQSRVILPVPERRQHQEPAEAEQEVSAPPAAAHRLHNLPGHFPRRTDLRHRVYRPPGERVAAELARTLALAEQPHRSDNERQFRAQQPVRGVRVGG